MRKTRRKSKRTASSNKARLTALSLTLFLFHQHLSLVRELQTCLWLWQIFQATAILYFVCFGCRCLYGVFAWINPYRFFVVAIVFVIYIVANFISIFNHFLLTHSRYIFHCVFGFSLRTVSFSKKNTSIPSRYSVGCSRWWMEKRKQRK